MSTAAPLQFAAPKSTPAASAKAAARPTFTPVRTAVLQRKCACGGTPGPTGECDECRKKRLALQRRAVNSSPPVSVPPIVESVLSSPGRPLDPPARSFMESRFGHDFGHVRIHDDANAAESARAVNAHAYTVGEHIAFGAGKYSPHTSEGHRLLAHELTHTLQQSGLQRSRAGIDVPTGNEEQRLEREADDAAAAIVVPNPSGIVPESISSGAVARPALMRQACEGDGSLPACGGGALARWVLEDNQTKALENVAIDDNIVLEGLQTAFNDGKWLTQITTPPNPEKDGNEKGRADGVKVVEQGDQLSIDFVEVKSCSKDGGGCARATREAKGYVAVVKPLVPHIKRITQALSSQPSPTSEAVPKRARDKVLATEGINLNDSDVKAAWTFLRSIEGKLGKTFGTALKDVVVSVSADGSPGTVYKAGAKIGMDCRDKSKKAGRNERQLVFLVNGQGGVSYHCENSGCGPAVTVGAAEQGAAPAPAPEAKPEIFTLRYGERTADVELPPG